MDVKTSATYDPKTFKLLTFYDAVPAFLEGSDTPRDYLERCIATIEAREPDVKAFVTINLDGARAAADASTERYRAGQPLSPIDGMPITVKDLYQTEDMPTQMGSPIFKDFQSPRDCAPVYALRKGGTVILGKVVTTEFGFYHPGPATNPFDSARTPGGSSSGSGACVGARMVPVSLGSHGVSSLLRPASFCANVGFKPSSGALNRAGGGGSSHGVFGPQAGCLEDAWSFAYQIASTVGGDAGQPGLIGGQELPAPEKPKRLARLDTPGWAVLDEAVRGKLEAAIAEIASHGIEIVSKDDDPKVAALEDEFADAYDVCINILGYEFHWPFQVYRDKTPDLLSDDLRGRIEEWAKLTLEDYRHLLKRRQGMRNVHEALKGVIDGFVTLASAGPAPVGIDATGNPIFGVPSSLLGAPALSLPLLEIDGMPLGLQLMGFPREDARTFAIANWIMRNYRI